MEYFEQTCEETAEKLPESLNRGVFEEGSRGISEKKNYQWENFWSNPCKMIQEKIFLKPRYIYEGIQEEALKYTWIKYTNKSFKDILK